MPTALVRELAVLVNRDHGESGPQTNFGPREYGAVVSLAKLVTDRSFQRDLLRPVRTFAEARELLETEIAARVPGSGLILVDGVWRLLRPAFLAVRDKVQGLDCPVPAICGILGFDPLGVVGMEEVQRPLEPFARYLDVLGTSLADRWANACELTLVAGQQNRPRSGSRQGVWAATFICAHGHWSRRTLNTAYSGLKKGRDGCPYCAGLRALAGFNSMAETHPRLAAGWHPSLNGTTTPSDVTGAGNSASYWWACRKGHEWQATPNNRAKGKGCPYCSGLRCIPGVNTLDVTHPDIAAEWNHNLNPGIAPSNITAGSGIMVHWVCSHGHEYAATPGSRTGLGRGCPVCANLRVLEGVNDLATTHRHIAAEWHPGLNGPATPRAVVAGSSKKYYWRCPAGHDYLSAVYSRTNGKGCPACAGQQIIAGFNDLRTTHPGIAAEWDHEANGSRTPESVIAGSARPVHWICALGHHYAKPINRRAAGAGCQYCSNRKVLPGFNDLATRHPDIARDWHSQKNGSLKPADVIPGNTGRWWKCTEGHEQFGTVPNRVKTRGCTACPLESRQGTGGQTGCESGTFRFKPRRSEAVRL
ncbi:zinc-ribbon domain-containing protein [Arthrobacter ramosus]